MNLLKDIGSGAWQVLKTVAPTLAAAASGPFAPLVEPLVAKIFGSADPKALEPALLAATPEQLLALKQADNDLQVQLKQLGISEEKLYFDDTASARTMQTATRDKTPGQLAWLIILGFLLLAGFECTAMIAFPKQWGALPGDAMGLLGVIFGYLANEAKQAAAFYFGSSAGSQAKDATLAEIAKS